MLRLASLGWSSFIYIVIHDHDDPVAVPVCGVRAAVWLYLWLCLAHSTYSKFACSIGWIESVTLTHHVETAEDEKTEPVCGDPLL